MYILKNAVRNISRSKARNILIGLIAFVIAVSACIGLSIRSAAESAKSDALDGISVTAVISFDRQSLMGQMGGKDNGGFDRDKFSEAMGGYSSLTLDEYKKYAEASSVKEFYYTVTASFNGSEGLDPVTSDSDNGNEGSGFMPGGMGGGMMQGAIADSGDFTVVGYSGENAMTDFIDGRATVSSGTVFDEGTEEAVCMISEELSVYNELSVGDTITIANPNNENETYELKIVGIYTADSSNDMSFSEFGSGNDPANKIYMSSAALDKILASSASVSETITDETTGREYESAVTGSIDGTYVFANTDDYYTFAEEVYTLGLDSSYTVSSPDITAYENSLTPLNTLGKMAGWFLVVILIIGAVILVVLNIFSVRERKYEIGVLTAIGMKKYKVAAQFLSEILIVTMAAFVIGAGVGAVSAVPVTNALLEEQVQSQQDKANVREENFGRGDMIGGSGLNAPSDIPDMGGGKKNDVMFPEMLGGAVDYITEIDSAVDAGVLLQLLGIGLLLTLVAGAFSVAFVMRYEPLKILANRD